jgi:hypothetical protein
MTKAKSFSPRRFVYKFRKGAIILPLPMSEQSAASSGLEEAASDLLDPYEKLISVEILGREVSVPEKNRLLRCFQYLSINTISYGDFCWNGECTNCQIWYHSKGQTEQNDRPALSCRMQCEDATLNSKESPSKATKRHKMHTRVWGHCSSSCLCSCSVLCFLCLFVANISERSDLLHSTNR